MVRSALPALALLALPIALTAQVPEGWELRADRPDQDVSEVAFTEMPPGWHVTTGPAVILYRPDMVAGGAYRVDMDVFLFDPEGRREAFGLFIGGRDLQGGNQRYTYFLIRDGGQFLVKSREGRETSTQVEWTDHPAIRGYDDRDEGEVTVQNVLTAQVGSGEIRFLVNDQEVTRVSTDGLSVEGIVGLRVNHALNLHISRFELSPGS
ncbi:MAG TPA: hypothetical protein VK858_18825 [Longimicrobiales bacterium]|nr:hypothetical protein [Longimicrobiales bacterium]